jgi:hypothetical protein
VKQQRVKSTINFKSLPKDFKLFPRKVFPQWKNHSQPPTFTHPRGESYRKILLRIMRDYAVVLFPGETLSVAKDTTTNVGGRRGENLIFFLFRGDGKTERVLSIQNLSKFVFSR